MAESDKAEVDGSKVMQVLTKNELERLTEVFKMYETGVREAAIRPSVSRVRYLLEVIWIWYFLDPDLAASQPYWIPSWLDSGGGTTSKLQIGSM